MRIRNIPALAATLGLAAAANAGVVAFDNFDVGNKYDCCTGAWWAGIDSIMEVDYDLGQGFFSAAAGRIESIDIAAQYDTGSNDFTLQLWDNDGGLPGAMLASWHIVDQMPPFGDDDNPVHIINSDPAAALHANTKYFLVASAADDASGGWADNIIGDFGTVVAQENNGGFHRYTAARGAFRVTLVPAPGSAALLGLAGLAARRRR